jgi:hypothetical protein
VGETFAQELCSVAPCRVGGWVITGAGRIAPCTLRVSEGELTIVHPPGRLLLERPASELEITSPVLRKFASVILQVDGELLAVEFDFVYRRKMLLRSRQHGILRAIQAVFIASTITYIPAMRLGRRLAAEFAAALLAAGAREAKAAPRPLSSVRGR